MSAVYVPNTYKYIYIYTCLYMYIFYHNIPHLKKNLNIES